MPNPEEFNYVPFPSEIPPVSLDSTEALTSITSLCSVGGYITLQESGLQLLPQRSYLPAEHAIDKKIQMSVAHTNEILGLLYVLPERTLLHYFDEDGDRIPVSEEEEQVFDEVRAIMQFSMDTARRPGQLLEQTEESFSVDDFFAEQVKKLTGKINETSSIEETSESAVELESSTSSIHEPDQPEIKTAEESTVVFSTENIPSLPEETLTSSEPDIQETSVEIPAYEMPFTFIHKDITLENMKNFFVGNGFSSDVAENFIAGADLDTLFSEDILTSEDINTLVEKCSYLVALLDDGVVFYHEKIPTGKRRNFDLKLTALPIEAFEQKYTEESFASYFGEGFLTREISSNTILSQLLKNEFFAQFQIENKKSMWIAEKHFARGWASEPVKKQGYYRFYRKGREVDIKNGIGRLAGLYLENALGEELTSTLHENGVSLHLLLGTCFYQSVANMEVLYDPDEHHNEEH